MLKYDYINNRVVEEKKIKLKYEGNDSSIKYSIEYLFNDGEHKYIINYNKDTNKYELYEDGKFLITL